MLLLKTNTLNPDGYEQGGLLYFHFENRLMVAVIRERSEFDKHRVEGTSLQGYIDTAVSSPVYGAALAIEALIEEKTPTEFKTR